MLVQVLKRRLQVMIDQEMDRHEEAGGSSRGGARVAGVEFSHDNLTALFSGRLLKEILFQSKGGGASPTLVLCTVQDFFPTETAICRGRKKALRKSLHSPLERETNP